MRLLLATKNKHKVEEIQSVLRVPGLILVSPSAFPGLPDVIEDGKTFEENAIKKAVELAQETGLWALADDSGLEVDALNGAPGVFSARYAGEPVSYWANNRKLLDELKDQVNRRARFRCVIALSSPSGKVKTVEGRCEGRIIDEERGKNGFGYDPIFIPVGYGETFAELGANTKNFISHRGRALKKTAVLWGSLMTGDPPDWPDETAGRT
jgi:XTP/dITP diphosphohydrolase